MKIDNANKRCPKCGETKLRTEFPRRKSCKDGPGEYSGVQSHCRACYNQVSKEFRANNPELAKQRAKNWKIVNPERAYRVRLGITMRNVYDSTLEHFDAMWEAQKGLCCICDRLLVPGGKHAEHPCIDHCHTTGKVRGILCSGCNKGLGNFLDKPVLLQRAIDYLKAHEEKKADSPAQPTD